MIFSFPLGSSQDSFTVMTETRSRSLAIGELARAVGRGGLIGPVEQRPRQKVRRLTSYGITTRPIPRLGRRSPDDRVGMITGEGQSALLSRFVLERHFRQYSSARTPQDYCPRNSIWCFCYLESFILFCDLARLEV